MLAHQQGGLLNAAAVARSLAVDGKTVAAYLDLLVDLLLVRRLAPWHGTVRMRLVKSPWVYLSRLPGRRRFWAFEIKRGLAPQVERGFRLACDTVQPERQFVVYGGSERSSLGEDLKAISLNALCQEVRSH
jgi:hypothetical protein